MYCIIFYSHIKHISQKNLTQSRVECVWEHVQMSKKTRENKAVASAFAKRVLEQAPLNKLIWFGSFPSLLNINYILIQNNQPEGMVL